MHAFQKLLLTEVKVTVRDVPVTLITIAFPVVVVAVFGLIAHPGDNQDALRYFYQPMSLSMGIGVLAFSLMATEMATYRERGILRRMAVTPVRPSRLLSAQLVVNAAIAAVSVVVIIVGTAGFGFPLPQNVPGFLVSILLSITALLSVGLLIAAVAPTARVATAVGVAFYFLNLVLGGIFVPKEQLPAGLANAGDFVPLGAMLSSLRATWAGEAPSALHLIVLGAYILVFGGLAVRLFRWE